MNKMGKELGSGGTSNVYEWGENEVIKVYKPHVTDDVIDNELYIGQILNNHSLAIPRLIGSINMNDKKALIYERISGMIMAEPILQGVYKTELANTFAQMHYDIHQKIIPELPSQYEFLKNRIVELTSILGDRAELLLKLLDRIPRANMLCHGDYQPLNVIGEGNEYRVIDWNGACTGNPILDVAWTYMTLNSPAIKQVLPEPIWELVVNFAKDYVIYYCKLSGTHQEDIIRCLPITAARRLYDNNQQENEISRNEKEWLLNLINN